MGYSKIEALTVHNFVIQNIIIGLFTSFTTPVVNEYALPESMFRDAITISTEIENLGSVSQYQIRRKTVYSFSGEITSM